MFESTPDMVGLGANWARVPGQTPIPRGALYESMARYHPEAPTEAYHHGNGHRDVRMNHFGMFQERCVSRMEHVVNWYRRGAKPKSK